MSSQALPIPSPQSDVLAVRGKAFRPEFHEAEDGLSYWRIPKLLNGGICCVIGTGPSLTQEDVDLCSKHPTIVVNDAYTLAPWADVLHGCDGKWWGWHPEAEHFQGVKTTLDKAKKHIAFLLHNGGTDGYETRPWSVRTGHNGGFQAVQIALKLGARKIVLLGLDHTFTAGKTHFFGDHPDGIKSTYPNWFKMWESLRPHLDTLGAQVVNCSRETALTVFPRRKLEDVI